MPRCVCVMMHLRASVFLLRHRDGSFCGTANATQKAGRVCGFKKIGGLNAFQLAVRLRELAERSRKCRGTFCVVGKRQSRFVR